MVTEYNIAMFLAKTSVLFLYRRIFPSPQIKTMSIIVMVIVAGYSLSLFLVSLLQCIPLSTLWTGKPGVCVDIATAYVALA